MSLNFGILISVILPTQHYNKDKVWYDKNSLNCLCHFPVNLKCFYKISFFKPEKKCLILLIIRKMQVQIVAFFFLTSSACHKQCLTSDCHRLGNADFCVLLGRVFSGKLWKIKLTCIQPCNCSGCTSRYLTHTYKGDRQRDVTMSIKATYQKQPKHHNDSLCSLYYRNTIHLQKFPKSPQIYKIIFLKKILYISSCLRFT